MPRYAWFGIALKTAWPVLAATIASVAISSIVLEVFSEGINDIGLIAAILAPLMLGAPTMFYMSLKHHQLQLAYRQLEDAASRDSLTNCLNHGAFVETVTSGLDDGMGGALLVVDADHFKSINDRFGHASGDTALKLIVSAIRRTIGNSDIVGRLGGEEFGVFLPGSNIERARIVADHIRLAVRTIEFDAGPQSCILSVSIGGAVSREAVSFSTLFRMADKRLYRVKGSGRNNIDIVAMPYRPVKKASAQPPAPSPLVYRGQQVRKA